MKQRFFQGLTAGFLSLLIVSGSAFTLSGCGQSPEEPEKPVLTGLPFEKPFEEHLDISVGFWNIQDMVNSAEKDAVLTAIEEAFNITIEPLSVNWIDYKERYQIMSATKSLPDLFASLTISSSDSNDTSMLSSLVSTGAIRSLPEDLSAYPNIDALMKQFDYIRYTDGRHYVLPRLSFQDARLGASDAAMLVRKDWMANLDLSEPANLEEFIDLICAFANDDPDGNGIDDTIGYNVNSRSALGKWVMLGIAPECNVYTYIKQEDGTYIPSYLTEDFRKVVSAYRTMYERGGLDPDFYIKKSTDATDDFARGRLGALEYKSSPSTILELEVQWELHQDIPFEDAVTFLHIFPAEDGKCYSNSSNLFWSESLFSSSVDDRKMERILYLMEYLLSEEGAALTRYGLEGIDYIYENGEYQCLLTSDSKVLAQALTMKYPSINLFSNLMTWGGSTLLDYEWNEMNVLRYGETAMSLAREDLFWNIDHTVSVERPYDFLLMPKEYSDPFSTTRVQDDFTAVIIGDEDPLVMWDRIVLNYYHQGLNDYIDRQNRSFAARQNQNNNGGNE